MGLLFTHKIHQSWGGGQGGFYRDANTKLAQPQTTKQRKCSNVLRLLVSMETPLSKFQVSMIIYQLNRQLLYYCRGAGKVMDTTCSDFRGYHTYFNTFLGARRDQGYHKMRLGNQRGGVNPCLLRRPVWKDQKALCHHSGSRGQLAVTLHTLPALQVIDVTQRLPNL